MSDPFHDILDEVKHIRDELKKRNEESGSGEGPSPSQQAPQPTKTQSTFSKIIAKIVDTVKSRGSNPVTSIASQIAEHTKPSGSGAVAGEATSGMEGLAKVAGTVGARLGVVVGVAAGVVAGFAALVVATGALAKKMLDAQRDLAQFNTRIAIAFAQMKFRDVQRDINTGEELAPSIEGLTEAFSDFQDALQPIKNLMMKVVNNVLTGVLKGLTAILNVINKFMSLIQEIWDWLMGKEAEAEKGDQKPPVLDPFQDFMRARSRGETRRQDVPLFNAI